MGILPKLMFIALNYMIYNFSSSCATEVFERNDTVWPSQFDPRFSREYIKEEKEVSRRQGLEIGRIEEAKAAALRMLERGYQENVVADIITILSSQQIQELKTSLNQ